MIKIHTPDDDIQPFEEVPDAPKGTVSRMVNWFRSAMASVHNLSLPKGVTPELEAQIRRDFAKDCQDKGPLQLEERIKIMNEVLEDHFGDLPKGSAIHWYFYHGPDVGVPTV